MVHNVYWITMLYLNLIFKSTIFNKQQQKTKGHDALKMLIQIMLGKWENKLVGDNQWKWVREAEPHWEYINIKIWRMSKCWESRDKE